jgi:hypothetical protein
MSHNFIRLIYSRLTLFTRHSTWHLEKLAALDHHQLYIFLCCRKFHFLCARNIDIECIPFRFFIICDNSHFSKLVYKWILLITFLAVSHRYYRKNKHVTKLFFWLNKISGSVITETYFF